eukprot:GEMP01040991.1.p1 GENE.GEMP01040991.1~~GEMP01040991.1.p1  ORF type:complete len:554 (+),score=50.09 GEMP01040991.1:86-1747(+)
MESALAPRVLPRHKREQHIFLLFCLIQAIINFDSGVYPAAIENIEKESNLGRTELGILGALPYVALTVMGPASGHLLSKFDPKYLIGSNLILNLLCNLLIVVDQQNWVLFLARFFVGISQASFLIHAPVWIEEYGPQKSKAIWVACLQAAVPGGLVVGYFVCSVFIETGVRWIYSMVVQSAIMAPLIFLFWLIPRKYIRVEDPIKNRNSFISNQADRVSLQERNEGVLYQSCELDKDVDVWNGECPHECQGLTDAGGRVVFDEYRSCAARQLSLASGGPQQANVASDRKSITTVLCNGLYLSVVFMLCSLFYVVSGIVYWCTDWLKRDFRPDGYSKDGFGTIVNISFGIVAITAPIAGVLTGGVIIDKCGGYGPSVAQQRKTLKIILVCALLASTSGFIGGLLPAPNGFWGVVVFLWLVLFFGGMIVPGATGILLMSVPPKTRPMASGIGQGAYNVFGYGLGTFLPGAIISLATPSGQESGAEERLLGMRFIFFWSVFGLIGLCISYLFVPKKSEWSEFDFREEDEEENDSIEMGPPTSPSVAQFSSHTNNDA